MKLIYIAGKFRGKNSWEIHQNVLRAEVVIPQLIEQGYAPICPHKLTENLQGLFSDAIYLAICLEILKRCDAIYMLGNWRQSKGSIQERDLALNMGKEIYYEEML